MDFLGKKNIGSPKDWLGVEDKWASANVAPAVTLPAAGSVSKSMQQA
jgi:hypothetical protein